MNEISFNDYLNLKNGSFVVAFGAPWCKDCRFAEPILNELAVKYNNIKFYHINVDSDESIREKMSIRHIPTILFIKDGIEICPRLVEPNNAKVIEEQVSKL